MKYFQRIAGLIIAGVWIFHGLFSKILGVIPRHEAIVARILGDSFASTATLLIGLGEIMLGCWVISGCRRRFNASLQTLALVSMNTLEIILAPDLLISPVGMVALNLCFLALIWCWAICGESVQPSELNEGTDAEDKGKS